MNWQTGKVLEDSGSCELDTLPSMRGGGASYAYELRTDLVSQHFVHDVWVNPSPSTGRCYDHVSVKAGYTHTWSPSRSVTAWQTFDAESDPDLVAPRICRH